MNKYGRGAIEAVRLIWDGHDPESAWMKRMKDLFPNCDPVKRTECSKICPKGAFFGLCKAGHVVGVNEFYLGDDCNNNGYYAVKAIDYLSNDSSLKENYQLTVVFSLWNEGMIKTD
jgi:hypothetical protein